MQKSDITLIGFNNLSQEKRDYLETVGYYTGIGTEDHQGAAVYYINSSGKASYILDYVLTNVKKFEKTAPEYFYRGGALLYFKTDDGLVVIPDERFGWLRLVGGIAKYSEGFNLVKTGIREGVIEELAVLSSDEKTRFVPKGTTEVSLTVAGWGFAAEKFEEVGEIEVFDYYFNEVNRALEAVIRWDVPGKIKVFHNEDWFAGGLSGICPLTIDCLGRITGIYSGRQGLIKIPVSAEQMKLHPTLKKVLKI